MILTRTALLEGVKKKARKWEQAAKKLKRASRKVRGRVDRDVERLTQEGPREGEDRESFAYRVLGSEDKLREKHFGKKKIRKKLKKLQSREQERWQAYQRAEEKESPEKRAKRLEKLRRKDLEREAKQRAKDARRAARERPAVVQPRTPIPPAVRQRAQQTQAPKIVRRSDVPQS